MSDTIGTSVKATKLDDSLGLMVHVSGTPSAPEVGQLGTQAVTVSPKIGIFSVWNGMTGEVDRAAATLSSQPSSVAELKRVIF